MTDWRDFRYSLTRINGVLQSRHRARAERALGKRLPPKAEVHHADGSVREDAPLVICQDRAYHLLLHMRMRVHAAGGDPNADAFCTTCKQLRPLAAFSRNKRQRLGRAAQCKECYKQYQQNRAGS